MFALARQQAAPRALFAVLASLVLAVRLLAPTGFMPTHDGDRVVVTLCSGTAGAKSTLALGGKTSPDKHGAADGPCGFAAGILPGLAAPAALTCCLPALFAAVVLPMTAFVAVGRGLAAPPPPAQAPPLR